MASERRRGGLGLFPLTGLSRKAGRLLTSALALGGPPDSFLPWCLPWPLAGVPAPPRRDIRNGFGELVGVPGTFGVAIHRRKRPSR
jgi:hypothetical protein